MSEFNLKIEDYEIKAKKYEIHGGKTKCMTLRRRKSIIPFSAAILSEGDSNYKRDVEQEADEKQDC